MDWAEKEEALKYIHILKANEHEMEVLTQCSDPYDAAVKLADWGVKEVLLTVGSRLFCRCHVFRQTTELRAGRWIGGRRT